MRARRCNIWNRRDQNTTDRQTDGQTDRQQFHHQSATECTTTAAAELDEG